MPLLRLEVLRRIWFRNCQVLMILIFRSVSVVFFFLSRLNLKGFRRPSFDFAHWMSDTGRDTSIADRAGTFKRKDSPIWTHAICCPIDGHVASSPSGHQSGGGNWSHRPDQYRFGFRNSRQQSFWERTLRPQGKRRWREFQPEKDQPSDKRKSQIT